MTTMIPRLWLVQLNGILIHRMIRGIDNHPFNHASQSLDLFTLIKNSSVGLSLGGKIMRLIWTRWL